VHRWAGLSTALFLIVAGLTGTVIAWDHEVDAWLAPAMYHAPWEGHAPRSPLELADRVEADDPRVHVAYLPLGLEEDHTLVLFVQPSVDPSTGERFEVDYDQVAVHPVTGVVQARRRWGELSLRPDRLVPMLYKLHYSLHMPWAFGIDLGALLMGLVAIVWTLDSVVALIIAFPNPRAWRRSFTFHLGGGPRMWFDLHRSGGVWLWAVVVVMAVTAVSMNLEHQVVEPLVSVVSEVTPSPWDQRTPVEPPPSPRIDRYQALTEARDLAERRQLPGPAGAIFFSAPHELYSVGFFEVGMDHGDGSLGNPWVYVDASSGEVVDTLVPGTGTAGDWFVQLQFPLHSGRLFGRPGRAAVSLLGLAIAGLAATGVWLWVRKQRRRRATAPAS
jgi:uncharacterized iron-regulated membrane protein